LFILSSRAIRDDIAHVRTVNALPTARTSALIVRTTILVLAVSAVPIVITLPTFWDARFRPITNKLVFAADRLVCFDAFRWSYLSGTSRQLLVDSVATILSIIACLIERYACPVCTRELVARWFGRTISLITAVLAVLVAIADPFFLDTRPVHTLELIRSARTVPLVTLVSAVRFSIALPSRRLTIAITPHALKTRTRRRPRRFGRRRCSRYPRCCRRHRLVTPVQLESKHGGVVERVDVHSKVASSNAMAQFVDDHRVTVRVAAKFLFVTIF